MTGQAQVKSRVKERICWKCGATFKDGQTTCPHDGSRLLDISPDDLDDPFIGELFDGRFRIIRKLGEGGMGSVYAARQMDFEREVALKILKADYLRNENIRKRFMYEARTISNLRHPNALRLFDFGQAPNAFYMVMELLGGESLADRLAYRFLSYGEILHIVPPICGVLGEAHRNEVIHRDLKPENIFLVEVNASDDFPKLLDFGIAKYLTDETMTQSGTLWGTPAYMSPEQAKGETVDASADVYAIGIILYELICGNLPFHSSTQMGLAMKHISVPARPLSSIPGLSSVPDELDALILRMLSKDKTERPSDMAELADALNDIKDRLFDDDLLASIPAEEVDAIALQDWIAAEPAVDDDVSIHDVAALPILETSSPPIPSPGPKTTHLGSPPSPTGQNTVDLSADFLVASRRNPWVIAMIAGVLTLAAIGGISVLTWMGEEGEQVEPNLGLAAVEAIGGDDPTSRAATDAAGRAAATIVGAQDTARRMQPESQFMVVDSPEMVGKDGKPQRRKSAPPKTSNGATKEEAREVKSALEKTF